MKRSMIYVDAYVTEKGNGTKEKPFQTAEEAQNYLIDRHRNTVVKVSDNEFIRTTIDDSGDVKLISRCSSGSFKSGVINVMNNFHIKI